MLQGIPQKLQGVLWSRDIKKLDLKRDNIYIIHQILSFGRMEDLDWLLQAYTKAEIIEVFIEHPYKDYNPARFNFIKNFFLQLKEQKLEEKKYVKNTPRYIG
jgi:hypothetical protein